MCRLATPDNLAKLGERILTVFPPGEDYMTTREVRERLAEKFAGRDFTYDEVLGVLYDLYRDRILQRGSDFPKRTTWKRP